MKVLLVGEYSGVHTNLAKALREKSIEVLTISDGDAYKQYPADISIKYQFHLSENIFLKKILSLYYILLSFTGLIGCLQYIKHLKVIKDLRGYDVVQVINPIALSGFGSIVNYFFLKFLINNNHKVFLCALGDDYVWVKGSMEDRNHKSMFSKMKWDRFKEYIFPFTQRYGFFYKALNVMAIKNVKRIIPGLQDYYYYYKGYSNCNEIIPIPIELDSEITPYRFDGYPIKIFHGWQTNKEARKGNDLFDSVVKSLIVNYPELIEYEIVGGVSYEVYIKKYDDSVIFLDQCYSMDRGVNALLGMAAGKVVIGGFNEELRNKYDLNIDQVMIDIEPEFDMIYKKIEYLLLNPSEIEKISNASILFMLENHSFDAVSKKYLDVWSRF